MTALEFIGFGALFSLPFVAAFLIGCSRDNTLKCRTRPSIDNNSHWIKQPISPTKYRSKISGVLFEELVRFDNQSVLLRTDINNRTLIMHDELARSFEKVN